MRGAAGWCERDPCADWAARLGIDNPGLAALGDVLPFGGGAGDIPLSGGPESFEGATLAGEFGLEAARADLLAADYLGKSLPVGIPDLIEYAFSSEGFALANTARAWAPSGTTRNYSNFGYLLLGRVVDALGTRYRTYVEQNIFNAVGMTRAGWATTSWEDRAGNEVAYYPSDPARLAASFVDPGTDSWLPYGGERNWSNVDANGGLLCSVVDLARFGAALRRDGGALSTALLPTSSIESVQDGGRGWDDDDDTTFAGIRDWTWGTKGFEVTRWWKAPMHTGSSAGSTSALYMFPKHEPAVVFGAGLPTWVTRPRPQDNALFVVAANRTPPSSGLQLWQVLRHVLATVFLPRTPVDRLRHETRRPSSQARKGPPYAPRRSPGVRRGMGQSGDPTIHVSDWGSGDLFYDVPARPDHSDGMRRQRGARAFSMPGLHHGRVLDRLLFAVVRTAGDMRRPRGWAQCG